MSSPQLMLDLVQFEQLAASTQIPVLLYATYLFEQHTLPQQKLAQLFMIFGSVVHLLETVSIN